MNKFLVLIFFAMTSSLALADVAPGADTSGEQNALTAKVSTAQPILLGWKSYDDLGRFQDLDSNKGRTFEGKQEVYMGYRADNGWGGFVQATQYRYEYNASTKNEWSVGDPSISLVHPDWYNDGIQKLAGYARYYVPFADYTVSRGMRQYAYYLTYTNQMEHGNQLFNQAIPRFFADTTYKSADDTMFYFEDRTAFTMKYNSWIRYGVGQWTQYEQHANPAKAPTGICVEAYPEVDFLMSKNIFISPRIIFPVLVRNGVYDAPTNASLGQTAAELYFQASL